jgi:hypothetical protein
MDSARILSKTLIVVPAFNESANLGKALSDVENTMPLANLLVGDHGSTDVHPLVTTHLEPVYSTESAILVIAFNRPETLTVLINQLRKSKPKKIYFAVDGPREGNSIEAQLVDETRALVSSFDWDCTLMTKFSEKNLGCGIGVSSAIEWAFESESRLIILEDDIIPDSTFLPYCNELLEFYKDDADVFAVSGCNFVPSYLLRENESYRFSQIPHVWGWALWKRSWDLYQYEIGDWRSCFTFSELRRALGGSWIAALLWTKIFNLMASGKIDTWDYQLFFAVLKNRKIVATSNVNLTENIGFGATATHTTNAPRYILKRENFVFPIRHPAHLLDGDVDRWSQKHVMGASVQSIFRVVIRRVRDRLRFWS